MLTNYRFDERYLRYAYLSYYQILELFRRNRYWNVYQKSRIKKDIYCEDTKGKDINCSEQLKMIYNKIWNGNLIQQTQGSRTEKELELGSYARIGSWMFARTTNRHFMTLLELNSTKTTIPMEEVALPILI